MEILLVTGNPHKLLEIRSILSEFGINVRVARVRKLEVQSEDVAEISRTAALHVARELGTTVVVEDAGLFIEALNGFPGPYSAYVFRTIGNEGIIRLMRGVKNRKAKFVSAVAYAHPDGRVNVFRGIAKGIISEAPRGRGGFGFDPIFIPIEGDGRTYAEMTFEEKNKISHRGKAFRVLAKWLTEQGGSG